MNNNFTAIFIKNFFNLSINQGINILIAIIATPILFQNLKESQFGLVNLAFSIFMLISIVVSYGYHLNGPKRISLINKINLERDLISELISLRFFIAVIVSLLIVFITFLTSLFNNYELIIICSIDILIGSKNILGKIPIIITANTKGYRINFSRRFKSKISLSFSFSKVPKIIFLYKYNI